MRIDGFYLFVAGEIAVGLIFIIARLYTINWLDKLIDFFGNVVTYVIFPILMIGGIWAANERHKQNKLWHENQRIQAQIRLKAQLKDKEQIYGSGTNINPYSSEKVEKLIPIEELIESGIRDKFL